MSFEDMNLRKSVDNPLKKQGSSYKVMSRIEDHLYPTHVPPFESLPD